MGNEKIDNLIDKNKKLFNLKNFKVIDIDHSDSSISTQRKLINSCVPEELGLYIYTSVQGNKVLYVGEGILRNRFKRHLNKVRPEHVQKDERNIFFHALKIPMKVFFVEASFYKLNKNKIEQLEIAYKLLLNPIYDQMVESKSLYKNCIINLSEWDN